MVEDVAEVLIRSAHEGDAEEIARVHIASLQEAYVGVVPGDYLAALDVVARTRRWREELAAAGRGTSIWVAQDEERVVGFASLGPSQDEDADRTTLQIYTIYLEPRAWGRGVARQLLRTVLAAVPEGTRVTLWVLQANERARHFYRRNGFTPDGVERLEEIAGRPYTEVRYVRG